MLITPRQRRRATLRLSCRFDFRRCITTIAYASFHYARLLRAFARSCARARASARYENAFDSDGAHGMLMPRKDNRITTLMPRAKTRG